MKPERIYTFLNKETNTLETRDIHTDELLFRQKTPAEETADFWNKKMAQGKVCQGCCRILNHGAEDKALAVFWNKKHSKGKVCFKCHRMMSYDSSSEK